MRKNIEILKYSNTFPNYFKNNYNFYNFLYNITLFYLLKQKIECMKIY